MNELISAWLNGPMISLAIIAMGFVLVLAGLIARSRQKRFEAMQSEEGPRPQMAPLPRLLSTDRTEKRSEIE